MLVFLKPEKTVKNKLSSCGTMSGDYSIGFKLNATVEIREVERKVYGVFSELSKTLAMLALPLKTSAESIQYLHIKISKR